MAKMNRLQKPNKILHYFNAPAKFTEQQIKQLCSETIDCEPQVKVSSYDSKINHYTREFTDIFRRNYTMIYSI